MERASIHLLWRSSDALGRWTARNYLAAARRGPDWKQRALRCRLEASNSLSNQQPRESIVSRPGSCPAVKLPPLFSGVARIENRITIQIGQLKRHVTKLVGSPSQVNARAPNQHINAPAVGDSRPGRFNPEGIASLSPGLRGTSYPATLGETNNNPINPERVAARSPWRSLRLNKWHMCMTTRTSHKHRGWQLEKRIRL